MSYNIDTFKVKELKDLKIPVASLYMPGQQSFHPERDTMNDGTTEFTFCEALMSGRIEKGVFHVDLMEWSGEGSGSGMTELLAPALTCSTGVLIASCVWEGGDSINRLEVNNGNVTWADIDI